MGFLITALTGAVIALLWMAALAESNPTPEQFDRVKARILEGEAA